MQKKKLFHAIMDKKPLKKDVCPPLLLSYFKLIQAGAGNV
jgi:hypothetical protein